MSDKTVELTPITDFAEQLSEREIVNISIGPDGEALVLAVAPQDKEKPLAAS